MASVWDLRLGHPEGWLGTTITVEVELGRSGGPSPGLSFHPWPELPPCCGHVSYVKHFL